MRRTLSLAVAAVAVISTHVIGVVGQPAAAADPSWTTPVQMARDGSLIDVAINASGDGIAAYIGLEGPGQNVDYGNRLFIARFIDGVWSAPERVAVPVPANRFEMWDYLRPRVAVNDSGQAIVAVWARAYGSAGPVIWATTSRDITQADSFGTVQRVDADGMARSNYDVSVGLTATGAAGVAWVASDPIMQSSVYAAIRPPDSTWQSPLRLGGSIWATGAPSVAVSTNEISVAFIQNLPDACKDELDQTVACFVPVHRDFDASAGVWGDSQWLDTPTHVWQSEMSASRSANASAYLWLQQVPDPYVDNTSWFRPRAVVITPTSTYGPVSIAAIDPNSTYATPQVQVSSDGQAVVALRSGRYYPAWFGYEVRTAIEAAVFDGASWTNSEVSYAGVAGGYQVGVPAIGLSPHSVGLTGATLVWLRGDYQLPDESVVTADYEAARRVNGQWVRTSDIGTDGGTVSINPHPLVVSSDASGNAVVASRAFLRNSMTSSVHTFVSTMGLPSERLASAPSDLRISDGQSYSGRPAFHVDWAVGWFHDSEDSYFRTATYEIQAFAVAADDSLELVTGAKCEVTHLIAERNSCEVPGRLASGRYVVKGRTKVAENFSPWSAPSSILDFTAIKTPSNPGWSVTVTVPSDRGKAFLEWLAPEVEGWSPVNGYRIEYQRAGDDVWRVLKDDTAGTALKYSATGLASGSYLFRVFARNAHGYSADTWASSWNPVEIRGVTAPGAVTALKGVAVKKSGKRTITFTWSAPAESGGSPVTGYHVRLKSGNGWTSWTSLPRTQVKLQYTVRAGQTITVQVRATSKPGTAVLFGPSAQISATAPA